MDIMAGIKDITEDTVVLMVITTTTMDILIITMEATLMGMMGYTWTITTLHGTTTMSPEGASMIVKNRRDTEIIYNAITIVPMDIPLIIRSSITTITHCIELT